MSNELEKLEAAIAAHSTEEALQVKTKTNELIGPALDWAVAKSEGERYGPPTFRVHQNSKGATVYLNTGMQQSGIPYRPSTGWAQGGPIIEQHIHKLFKNVGGTYTAQIRHEEDSPLTNHKVTTSWTNAAGPTPLIAAMRCFVASKLGDEVDVPEELCASST